MGNMTTAKTGVASRTCVALKKLPWAASIGTRRTTAAAFQFI